MNIQLTQAVTDVMGVNGQKIIRAIVAGEREPETLAAFREPGCKHSVEEIKKALRGTWREEHLYVLKQSLEIYDFYSEQITGCNDEIERRYAVTRPEWVAGELVAWKAKKNNSHSKNAPQNQEEIRKHLKRLSGVDLSVVYGFGVSLAQTVIMEVGSGYESLSGRQAFLFMAGTGAQARHHWRQGVEQQNDQDQEPCRSGISDGGSIGEAGTFSGLCAVTSSPWV